MSGPPGEPRRVGYLFVVPALLAYVVFTVAPAVQTVGLSLFQWDGVNELSWIGLANYRAVLGDAQLLRAFTHSLVLLVFYSLLPVLIGMFVATTIARVRIRGVTVFRTVLFLPQVVASVSVAVTWRWIYAEDGPLNTVLRAIGLDGIARAWLGDFTFALPSVGAIGTWTNFGLCMVLFIAGLQKISPDLYDAARVDGANALQEFFAVTLPALRREIAVATTITVIGALRTFDVVFVTTAGGPGDATNVPAIEIYQRAFQYGRVGSAAAVATVLGTVIAVVALLVTRLGEDKTTDEQAA